MEHPGGQRNEGQPHQDQRREYRPAELTVEQLDRLRRLERELGVVLVAYTQGESRTPEEDRPDRPGRPIPGR